MITKIKGFTDGTMIKAPKIPTVQGLTKTKIADKKVDITEELDDNSLEQKSKELISKILMKYKTLKKKEIKENLKFK